MKAQCYLHSKSAAEVGGESHSLLSLQPIHKLPYFSGILAAGL